MLDLVHGRSRDCEGLSRREMLQVGVLGLGGLSLPGLLRLEGEARAAEAAAAIEPDRRSQSRENLSVIVMWMQGGPSHIDTFDPKPDAPLEIRGEFQVTPTSIPGVHFTEHVPRLAKNIDKFTMIRNGYSYNGSHGVADAYMLSGWRFSPTVNYPSYGSVVTKELGYRRGMPPYVQLGNNVDRRWAGGEAGYLGEQFNPFIIGGDPNNPQFSIDGISLPGGITTERFARRQSMLQKFDRWQKKVETSAGGVIALDSFYEKAFGIVTSPKAKDAFDLSKEDAQLRDRYGRNPFGQSCLLARRLVEAGVRLVNVTSGGWDTHAQNFTSLKDRLLPALDGGWATLLEDLKDRGMLDTTLVIWLGDFGRTPKVNSAAGRDHWAGSTCFGIGGGGVKTGLVVGASDKEAGQPLGSSIQVEDIAVTLYTLLGIPVDKHYTAPDGRPFRINVGGRVLDELLV